MTAIPIALGLVNIAIGRFAMVAASLRAPCRKADAMQWKHDEIMSFIPFALPNMNNAKAPNIGVAVARGQTITAERPFEPMFMFGGVATQAEALLFASPMMYQALARVANVMAQVIANLDTMQAQGAPKEEIESAIALYRAVELDVLTAMQIATEGLDRTATGLKGDRG